MGTLKSIDIYWIPYAHALTFMSTLTIHISSLCTCSACSLVFSFFNCSFNPQHARKELMRAISNMSMHIRNCWVGWAYASGTDTCAELVSQELVRALSIRVSYICVHRSQSLQSMLSIRISNWCTLSIRVRNWCVCWAYKAGTDVYPKHKHKFLTHMLIRSAKIPNFKRKISSKHADHADAWAEHTNQELMRALKLNDALLPQNLK